MPTTVATETLADRLAAMPLNTAEDAGRLEDALLIGAGKYEALSGLVTDRLADLARVLDDYVCDVNIDRLLDLGIVDGSEAAAEWVEVTALLARANNRMPAAVVAMERRQRAETIEEDFGLATEAAQSAADGGDLTAAKVARTRLIESLRGGVWK